MKKKRFILVEAILALMVTATALAMVLGLSGKRICKVSVIIQNADAPQWNAFKYGLKMAANDMGAEMVVVSTEELLTLEEEQKLIENEIESGADAVIVQPAYNPGIEKMLEKINRRIPILLIEHGASYGESISEERNTKEIVRVQPDNVAMGNTLAQELLADFKGNLDGKTIGIVSENKSSEAVMDREAGFLDGLKDQGVAVQWYISGTFSEEERRYLKNQTKVDFVIALDDASLTTAGACSAVNDLHGALVYGIGRSTEAVYYLDTDYVECLIVPDDFNMGYRSLTQAVKNEQEIFYEMKEERIPYDVLRKNELFTKENQEIIFSMSQ